MHKLALFAVIGLLTLTSSIASAETPDECAARLDQSIDIRSYAAAAAWWEQVQRECMPEPAGEDKDILRLEVGEVAKELPNTKCRARYTEFGGNAHDAVIIAGIRPLPSKTFKLYWRHGITGEWQRIQESQHDEETMIYQEPIILWAVVSISSKFVHETAQTYSRSWKLGQ